MLSRSGDNLKLTNCVTSDRRIPLFAGIPLCKSRELSLRGYSMSQLCSIHHDIPVTLHTPGVYGQWSVFDHNGDKHGVCIWWLKKLRKPHFYLPCWGDELVFDHYCMIQESHFSQKPHYASLGNRLKEFLMSMLDYKSIFYFQWMKCEFCCSCFILFAIDIMLNTCVRMT